jgi:citrate synthase
MELAVRIGKQDAPYQSICTSDAETITVRQRDLCGEVMGKLGFVEYFWLMVTGIEPTLQQAAMTNAALAAIAEHGLVPSVVAARMTLAAAPEALQGAVAAGLLGCGSVVLGSAETAGFFYKECLETEAMASLGLAEVVDAGISRLRSSGQAVPGFGHPQHSGGDPRANRLIALAAEYGVASSHIDLLDVISARLPETIGRSLPLNVNGAIAAVMLDAGFPLAGLKGISLLARTAGLIAHLVEEQHSPIGFILAGKAADAIAYRTSLQTD